MRQVKTTSFKKSLLTILSVILVVNGISSVAASNAAGTWAWTDQSAVGNHNWHALATSSDGSRLYAASESCGASACSGGVIDAGGIWTSSDYGMTWSEIASTSGRKWFSIASNIDGTKVVAVDRGGDIYTSTDSGSTWTQRRVGGAVHNWESVASSSDGNKLVAVASDGYIFTSVDSGSSWTNKSPAGSLPFTGVSSSNNGSRIAATTWSSGLYLSADYGATWTRAAFTLPNPGDSVLLQSVAMSGDGSRLVTGSRPYSSNGGIVFTSSNYGSTWTSSAQRAYDYIGFVSSGNGSNVAAAIYGQSGVSTSDDYGVTWTFQQTGNKGIIPLASNIDGSLLFVGGYGGHLWTGKIPNARVVAVVAASTSANVTAGASTPATALTFPATASTSAVRITPIANPTATESTPFDATSASIFDISVVNITGQVTVCVDGGPTVRLWHYTNGSWVDVTTSQTVTQTCGLTSSFSPFATAALRVTPAQSEAAAKAAAEAAAAVAAAKREAEIKAARLDISNRLKKSEKLTLDSFKQAEIAGVTAENFAQVQAEILQLPQASRSDINEVLKVARKYEVVGQIASGQASSLSINAFVEVGLIPAESKNKVALIAAVRRAPSDDRDSFTKIKAAIAAEFATITARKDRLASAIARIKNRLTL
jgi:photosystem II stability/assembly factor-like uncharacterized protein